MPLLNQLVRHPELWNQNTLRTTHANSPHSAVSDIWLRFNNVIEYEKTGNPSAILDQHESIWYPASHALTEARPLVFGLMARVKGVRLGRVLITKLSPGKKIDRHADSGDHAAYFERYHFALQSLPGSMFECGGEVINMPPGTVWWMQNQHEHCVENNSADDRIHLIADIKQ